MDSTTAITNRSRARWLVAIFGALLCSFFLLAGAPPAFAEEAPVDLVEEETGGEEIGEEHPYQFRGIVRYEGEPLEGVRITVEGGGYFAEAITNEEGRWSVGVPEREPHTITLDEDTLPEGIIVEDGASMEREFGQTNTANVNFFLGVGERVTTSFVDQFVERLINGLNFGLLLGLASLGVSLIFGTTGLTNFAHAEAVTFGAVMAFLFGVGFALPMWIALPIVVVLAAVLGWLIDAGLWKPLRRRGLGLVQLMIVSIGLSFAGRYTYQFFMGGDTYQLPGAGQTKLQLWGPIRLSVIDMISMGVSAVLLVAVAVWLLKSRTGKATRAISDNPPLAAASGINVDRVVRIVWMLSTALAAIAGVLWAYFRPGLRWDMGMQILLLIFAAVVLGGLGTAFGAMVGAIIVGILVEISTLWLPSDLKYVGALVVLIAILLVRPTGLLGRKERIG